MMSAASRQTDAGRVLSAVRPTEAGLRSAPVENWLRCPITYSAGELIKRASLLHVRRHTGDGPRLRCSATSFVGHVERSLEKALKTGVKSLTETREPK